MLPPLPVVVQYRGSRGPRLASALVRQRVQRMLDALGLTAFELSVLLCDGAVMRVLNRRHRGADYATDVLAFEIGAAEAVATGLLGDIVVCIPTAFRQAQKAGNDPVAEVTMLLAHGLLHLLGCDHRNRREERRMRSRTDLLIAAAMRRPGRSSAQRGGKVAAAPSKAALERAYKKPTSRKQSQ